MIPERLTKDIKTFHFLFGAALGFCLLLIGSLIYVANAEKGLEGKIYPNVFIDGQNVGKKTQTEAALLFKNKNQALQKLLITVTFKKEPIATLSASKLHARLSIKDAVEQAYLIGRVTHLPSRTYQKLSTIFNIGRYDFPLTVAHDQAVIQEFIADAEERYNKPAKNALFKFENNRVVSFRPEEKGIKIESEKFKTELQNILSSWKEKPKSVTLALHDTVLEPEITLAKTNQFGIEELIGEGISDFAGSIPERVHNVTLAAARFNGVLIPKDKTISFNEIVGDISGLTGYKQAYIIKGGKTVLGDGGGVCQVSTTLFRAALNTGLPIVERNPHAYRVGYYENDSKPGFDATVYAPTVDLKIKNNSSASVLIQTEIVGAKLFFRLYGKKDDRKVELSQVTLWDVSPPPPPSYQDDPTLKKGVTKQIDFAAWGGKSSFNYKVTSGNPEINFERKFFSSYRPWQAVFLVGQAD